LDLLYDLDGFSLIGEQIFQKRECIGLYLSEDYLIYQRLIDLGHLFLFASDFELLAFESDTIQIRAHLDQEIFYHITGDENPWKLGNHEILEFIILILLEFFDDRIPFQEFVEFGPFVGFGAYEDK
jgi:hypothetical protein